MLAWAKTGYCPAIGFVLPLQCVVYWVRIMKVFLSGIRTWYSYFARWTDKWGPLPEGAPSLVRTFPSFWYERNNPNGLLTTQPGREVILDSGAHTLFSAKGLSVHGFKVTSHVLDDIDEYFQDFTIFVKRNWDRIDYFVELDIAKLITMEKVQAMRQDLMNAGLWDKCIPAWHRENGWDDWQWMIDNATSGYVAIEGIYKDAKPLPYNRFIKPCWEAGVKIHGFALMYPKVLENYPFYSIDCASWLAPVIYGMQPTWVGTKLRQIGSKRGDGSISSITHPAGKLKEAIKAYRMAEQYYTDYWKSKGIDWDEQIKRRRSNGASN